MSPIFEYRCKRCGKVEEKYCKGGGTDVYYSCECGSPMDKLISAPALFDVKGANAKNGYTIKG